MKRMGKMYFFYEGANAEFDPPTTEQLQELLLACMPIASNTSATVAVKREVLGGIIGELQRRREVALGEEQPPFPSKK